MPQTYSLRLFDQELLRFTLAQKGIEGLTAAITCIDQDNRHLLPLDMEATDGGILKWLQRRFLPRRRAYADEILQSLGLSRNDLPGIVQASWGLSLQDSYWLAPLGCNAGFAEVNFFTNPFGEGLAQIALTGAGAADAAFTTSPELTTNGMLPKAWRFIDHEGIYLYKGGTSGAANTGNEPFSEYYACQVAQAMGLNAVAYELENWKGILASKCKLFTDINTTFIPIGYLIESGGLPACLDYYKQLGREALEQVHSMLVFDAVIYNEDRHYGNFGVLRDNHSGKVLGPAPIFDNGLSLFNFAMDDDLAELDAYAKTRTTPYNGVSYEAVCAEVMGPRQREQLRRLVGFRFTRHPQLNLPEPRLIAIEKHLQKRVRQLLDLPREKQPGREEKER